MNPLVPRQYPEPDRFRDLLARGLAVPVVRELVVDAETPITAWVRVSAGARCAALLETAEPGAQGSDMSIIAVSTRPPLRVEDATVTDPFELVRARSGVPVAGLGDPETAIGIDLPPFVGGLVGYVGHECIRCIEPRVPLARGVGPIAAPDAAFLEADELLVFDHRRRRVLAIAAARPDSGLDADEALADAEARLDRIEAALAGPLPEHVYRTLQAARRQPPAADPHIAATPNMSRAEYEAMVEQVREHVHAGDVVQTVVSQRFDRTVGAEPLQVYRALRATSPAPYMFLLSFDDLHLIGASPEQLVGVDATGVVTTRPIAGTRPRGADAAADVELAIELAADPKERSEHMMLVDLGRNDVGRVAVPGTVAVPELGAIERFSHVMHLVSRVTGRLRADLHPIDALRSCFPAGTLSGAPKIRAMEIIAELEPDRRGPYGGAVGWFGHDGALDTAIAIRTIVLSGGMASVQAGAGIVSASDPAAEYEETYAKSRAPLLALDVAERMTAAAIDAEAARVGEMA